MHFRGERTSAQFVVGALELTRSPPVGWVPCAPSSPLRPRCCQPGGLGPPAPDVPRHGLSCHLALVLCEAPLSPFIPCSDKSV